MESLPSLRERRHGCRSSRRFERTDGIKETRNVCGRLTEMIVGMQTNVILPLKRIRLVVCCRRSRSERAATAYATYTIIRDAALGPSRRRSCRRAERGRARPNVAERGGRRERTRERRRVCTEYGARAPVRRERSLFEKKSNFSCAP